jgi:trk system potassium uptake protein TrkH
MPTIVLHLAFITGGLSALMLFPALTAWSRGESDAALVFVTTAILAAGGSLALIVALRGITVPARRVHALMLVCLVWPLLAAIAAVPIWLTAEKSYLNAMFEALSAVTTTGFTLIGNLDAAPAAILAWRAGLQWYGGFLALLAVTLILAPLAIGGLPQRRLSFMDESAQSRQIRLVSQIRLIGVAYGMTTLACLLWLLAASVPQFEALCLAMATVSTGGMTVHDGPIETFVSPLGQVGLIGFMIIGSTSIIWQGMILRADRQQLAQHRESYYGLALILVIGLVIATSYHSALGRTPGTLLTALREGIFTAASIVSTTGFHVREESFSVLPVGVLFALVLVGGGAMSTAGGLKLFRVGILAAQGARELSLSLFPHGVDPLVVGGRRWDREILQGIYAMVLVFAVVMVGTMAVLSYQGIPFEPAMIASISAMSNAGPIFGAGPDAGQPWPSLSSFPPASLVALSVAMILGRIELLALFSVLNFAYWRSR